MQFVKSRNSGSYELLLALEVDTGTIVFTFMTFAAARHSNTPLLSLVSFFFLSLQRKTPVPDVLNLATNTTADINAT